MADEQLTTFLKLNSLSVVVSNVAWRSRMQCSRVSLNVRPKLKKDGVTYYRSVWQIYHIKQPIKYLNYRKTLSWDKCCCDMAKAVFDECCNNIYIYIYIYNIYIQDQFTGRPDISRLLIRKYWYPVLPSSVHNRLKERTMEPVIIEWTKLVLRQYACNWSAWQFTTSTPIWYRDNLVWA